MERYKNGDLGRQLEIGTWPMYLPVGGAQVKNVQLIVDGG